MRSTAYSDHTSVSRPPRHHCPTGQRTQVLHLPRKFSVRTAPWQHSSFRTAEAMDTKIEKTKPHILRASTTCAGSWVPSIAPSIWALRNPKLRTQCHWTQAKVNGIARKLGWSSRARERDGLEGQIWTLRFFPNGANVRWRSNVTDLVETGGLLVDDSQTRLDWLRLDLRLLDLRGTDPLRLPKRIQFPEQEGSTLRNSCLVSRGCDTEAGWIRGQNMAHHPRSFAVPVRLHISNRARLQILVCLKGLGGDNESDPWPYGIQFTSL